MQTVETEMGNTNVSIQGPPYCRRSRDAFARPDIDRRMQQPQARDAFVQIVPGNTTVGTGATFTMYTSASPKGVTWAITKTTGCTGNACGTLSGATDTSVVYNAPVSMSGSTMSVTITATSKTDSSISASQTLTVYPVSVQLTGPSNTTVVPLTTALFTASVPGDLSNSGVTWTVTGSTCAGSTEGCGSFRGATPTQATYLAPPAPQFENVTVTATSSLCSGRNRFDHAGHSETRDLRLHPHCATGSHRRAAIFCNDPGSRQHAALHVFLCEPPLLGNANTGPQSVTLAGTPPAGTQGTAYPTITVTDSETPNPTVSGQPFALTTYPAAATGNSLLTGSYAFFATGWTDGTSVQTTYNGIEYIGSFTADGNGNITGGELDINDPNTGITSYSTLGGTYNLQYGVDSSGNPVPGYQTGFITLVPPGKPPFPITLAVSLSSIQNLGTSSPRIVSPPRATLSNSTTPPALGRTSR